MLFEYFNLRRENASVVESKNEQKYAKAEAVLKKHLHSNVKRIEIRIIIWQCDANQAANEHRISTRLIREWNRACIILSPVMYRFSLGSSLRFDVSRGNVEID